MMSFGQSIRTVFGKYADFTSRASRSEYWWWVLFTVLAALGWTIILGVFGVVMGKEAESVTTSVSNIITFLWSLALFLPNLAVIIRRLRDAGFHWAMIFIVFIPIIGGFVLLALLVSPSKANPAIQTGTPVEPSQAMQPSQTVQTPEQTEVGPVSQSTPESTPQPTAEPTSEPVTPTTPPEVNVPTDESSQPENKQ